MRLHHTLRRTLTAGALFAAILFAAILSTGGSTLEAQPFERIISDTLDERPNCVEHTVDGGYIIAGTQKDIPFG